MSGRGGIYKDPGGDALHGDGIPVENEQRLNKSTAIGYALAEVCQSILERIPEGGRDFHLTNPTPYTFAYPAGERFHLRIKQVGDDTRIEYAVGSLDREWGLVLDRIKELPAINQVGVLLALHDMLNWLIREETSGRR